MSYTITAMKSLALAAALTFVLSACGCGGGGGDPEPGAPAPPPAPAPLVTIAAYGDSTQQGLMYVSPEVGYVVCNQPPKIAQKKLREWASQDRISVLNEGLGGTNAPMLLNGTDGKHKPWVEEMAASPAQIVSINHSLNDYGYPTATFKANMLQLVQIAQAAGKKVIVETSNPVISGTAVSDPINLADLAARAQAAREVATQTGAVLCDQFKAIEDAGMVTREYLPDGVHPSGDLYYFKGVKLGQCALPLVLGILGGNP